MLLASCLTPRLGQDPLRVPTDYLFGQKTPTCREWALAANYYIALGEEKGLKRLLADSVQGNKDTFRHADARDRAANLCRILFEPKGEKPIRQPLFGVLSLPMRSMRLEQWPQYPMVEQDGVWFVLAEGYMLGGLPEELSDYVSLNKELGTYRKKAVDVPSSSKSLTACESLLKSSRWKAIRWSFKSPSESYTYNESWTIELLREQAKY